MSDYPEPFKTHVTELLGREEFERVMAAKTRSAIRVNTLQITTAELLRRLHALGFDAEVTPFCDHAIFWNDPQERGIGNLWEHQAGHLFSQDGASVLPALALDPQPGESVVDLCAAPGGKASHIAQLMQDKGLIVANDPSPGRCNNMASNLDRMGTLSTVITQVDAVRRRWPMQFDRVLVDAPCSNLGHCHTNKKIQYKFRADKVSTAVGLQRGILESAFHATKVGGTIVYSTCTMEVRENEAMVSAMLDHFPVELQHVDLGLKGRAPPDHHTEKVRDEVLDHTLRLHPGDADTDGFFVAKLTKIEELPVPDGFLRWNRQPHGVTRADEGAIDEIAQAYAIDDEALEGTTGISTGTKIFLTRADHVDEVLKMGPERVGIYLATPEGKGPRMSFEASTTSIGRHSGNAIEVSREAARQWMTGRSGPAIGAENWTVLTCEGEAIGTGRDFGEELHSYVPKNRRVPVEGEYVGFMA